MKFDEEQRKKEDMLIKKFEERENAKNQEIKENFLNNDES